MLNTQTERDGRNDFDFFIGIWNVHHRRLRERLKGSDSWEEFDSISVARKVLNGMGNFDEIVMERESGQVIAGVTLRLYNPISHEWSLYWADSVSSTLQVPMVGKFDRENGRGEFFSQEMFEGRHIYSRFIWSAITHDSCRWEQAFSADGGKSWETNWIMDFTRRGKAGEKVSSQATSVLKLVIA
jgi:hypothetical protein